MLRLNYISFEGSYCLQSPFSTVFYFKARTPPERNVKTFSKNNNDLVAIILRLDPILVLYRHFRLGHHKRCIQTHTLRCQRVLYITVKTIYIAFDTPSRSKVLLKEGVGNRYGTLLIMLLIDQIWDAHNLCTVRYILFSIIN